MEEKIEKNKILEKLETIDHLLYSFYKQNKDASILKSIIEEILQLFVEIIDYKLKNLKKEGKIKVIPREVINKVNVFFENYKENFDSKDEKVFNIMVSILENPIYFKKYGSYEDAENFYILIKKIFDF